MSAACPPGKASSPGTAPPWPPESWGTERVSAPRGIPPVCDLFFASGSSCHVAGTWTHPGTHYVNMSISLSPCLGSVQKRETRRCCYISGNSRKRKRWWGPPFLCSRPVQPHPIRRDNSSDGICGFGLRPKEFLLLKRGGSRRPLPPLATWHESCICSGLGW